MATTFKTVFDEAISSISKGITGLIVGTQNWGQALRQIGTSFLTAIVNGIVEMGVRWVLTHVIMKAALVAFHAVARALGWESAVETTAQQATMSSALATNAINQSITSYGAAAIAGEAAYEAALAAGLASALAGSFAGGGFTGRGG